MLQRIFFSLFFCLAFQSIAQIVQPTNSANAPEMNSAPQLEESPQEMDYRTKEIQTTKKAEAPKIQSKSTVEQASETSAQLQQKLAFQLQNSVIASRKNITSRSPLSNEQQKIISLVNQLEKTGKESFEYHYFKYVSGNYNFNLVSHLNRAHQLKPTNTDVLVQLVAYHWILNNKSLAVQFIEQLFTSGRLDPSLKEYASDLLRSVPENGALITHGVEDTYAVLYLQESKKMRTDVQVLSLDWFQNTQFRDFVKSHYYELPKSNQIDVNYLSEFCQLNASKKLSLSFTLPSPYFQPLKSSLYVQGLVAVYSNHSNELNVIDTNVNFYNTFDLKRLSKPTSEREADLSSNYLPMLITLRKAEENSGIPVSDIDRLIQQITNQSKHN
jgi:hypothetical protein